MVNKLAHVEMVAITGSRDIRYSGIKEKLDTLRKLYPDAMWISNGAVGTSLAAAKYAMLNKIPLFMCLPFPPKIMTQKWMNGWRDILEEAMEYAQKVVVVSDEFSLKGYQNCGELIIASADVVVAFNKEISGEGFDYIKFAESVGKPIVDGFSLSAPRVAERYPDLLAPIRSGIITANFTNSRGIATYGIGAALQIQNIIPLEPQAW